MIYIIDNNEPPIDNSIYFVQISEEEKGLFGDTLEAILINMRPYNDGTFISGIADHIRWIKKPPEAESFHGFVYIFHLLQTDDNSVITGRNPKIPRLSDAQIDYLIKSHIQSFPKDKDVFSSNNYNIPWDDIRAMLNQ